MFSNKIDFDYKIYLIDGIKIYLSNYRIFLYDL